MAHKGENKPNPLADALENELSRLDRNQFPNLANLVETDNHKVKIRVKVNIPADKYPNTNFVGKILGPKASTLKMIQDTTRTRMSILGQNSMRDESKEKELLETGDSKYSHLKQKLHLQIDAYGQPIEAYYCMYMALSEAQKAFNTPDQATPESPMAPPQRGRGGHISTPRGGGRGGRGAPPMQSPVAQGYPPAVTGVDPMAGTGYPPYGVDPSYGAEAAYPIKQDPEMPPQMGVSYGQSQTWGKMPNQPNRGRGRGRGGHPYAKPGVQK